MKKFALVVGVISIFSISTNLFAANDIKEGLWEISSKMVVKGMNMQIPPVKFTSCIKKDELVPSDPAEKTKNNCKTYNVKVTGNTVSWELLCKSPEGDMKGKGEITYKGTSFKGKLSIFTQGMEMKQEMEGKWLGPCK
ncbi:MAG: DUF3617 domain-containing protein [Calditerrivibrio sp.]|nr:DUF3617 domain-containing protein [Calditerrivibrio sp.]MCA1932051.1 DUF3617 domain-containing protein [Calditerrivibrio sp.]